MIHLLMMVFFLPTGSAFGGEDDAGKAAGNLSKIEQELVELTNKERTTMNIRQLKVNPTLMKVARAHALNMAKQNQLSHDLDGQSAADRIKAAGYRFGAMGENVGGGQRTPVDALKSWMDSEGHRANILGEQFSEFGVGQAKSANGMMYYVLVFASPLRGK